MELQEALKIAKDVKAQLAPFCSRIEIAGSIRRKKPQVKDIEIVAIPVPWETGLFLNGIGLICSQWEKVKGSVEDKNDVRYTQRILPEGIKLDLFFANKDNWGLIYAIRTGSADYSHKVLGTGWTNKGYKSIDGMLTYNNRIQPVREEIDLFNLLNLEYCEPEKRNV